MTSGLHTELWTSWASMLRVYAAAYGLTSESHAVVEIGREEITLRVGMRWIRFSPAEATSSDGTSLPFALFEDGRVQVGDSFDELDLSAERVAREMFTAGS